MSKTICRFFIILALTFSSFMVRAQDDSFEDVTLLARIHSVKDVEALSGYAVTLSDEALKKVLSNLSPDDEVILKGSIRYAPVTKDNRTSMNPTFIISKIIPVSLKRIGESEFKVAEPRLVFNLPESPGAKSIPVSGKLATAITLTATILLLQNLSSGTGGVNPKEKLQSQVFLGAGALATGAFIWEEFSKGTLK